MHGLIHSGAGKQGADRFIGWTFLVIGLGFLTFGVFSITDTVVSGGSMTARTEGTVVGVESKFIGGESNVRLPTVTFVTEGGRTITFTSNTGGGGDRIGDSVTVRYDPADPTNAKIDSPFHLWGLSAIMLAIGGILTFFGIDRLRGKSNAERQSGSPDP